MTDDRTNWDALVNKARQEAAPTLDVAAGVAQRISWTNTLPLSNWPTWSTAAVSIAAALMMMATALMTGVSWNDPLGDWFSSMFLVMS